MAADHIALIVHDFSTGGSERIAIRLANDWAASGRRVTILCGTEQGAVRGLVSSQIAVDACSPETPRSPWSRLQLGWRLTWLVRKHRPDVVFAPGNFHLVPLAILTRRRLSKRPAFHCKLSNPISGAGTLGLVSGLVTAWAAKYVDMLVAMSPALRTQAMQVFYTTPIETIAEPILDDHDEPLSAAKPTKRPLIICAGRLCRQKNFLTAIAAFAKLDPALGATLHILGEGPQRQILEREAERLGVGAHISFAGYVADIRPYLLQADLFLMTSLYEGYPAVLIEAMAAGLPIVTTNCSPAIAEIIASPVLGQVAGSSEPTPIAESIQAQLAKPRPAVDDIASVIGRHGMRASAKAYLALFDKVAA